MRWQFGERMLREELGANGVILLKVAHGIGKAINACTLNE